MNPYRVPGLEAIPYAPLRPHLNKGHDELYVPVDDTEREFRRFQDTMNTGGWPTESGRLVVVTGKQGCGKTSLINRCAAWLRDELVRGQLMGEIFTLTDSGTPYQSIMLRMEQVLTDLVHEFRDERRGVCISHITRLENMIREIEDIERTSDQQDRHVTKVDRVYRSLHDALPADRIAIILLPPSSDLVEEIKSYAGFARHPRIVFFAETDEVETVQQMWQTNPTNDRMPPILLRVGPLNPGDGWTYAHARQGSSSADTIFPTVSEETMQRVISRGGMSIRWLHKLLYGVYEDLALHDTLGDSLSYREVSFERIAEYVLAVFRESGSTS